MAEDTTEQRTDPGNGGDSVVIKKYANRRLYDTRQSRYITLDDLARMIRAGQAFTVVDAKTGEDLTRGVLAQIIMEQEAAGETLLPVNFLRELIGMYGQGMQAFVPDYLDASMDSLRRNQEQIRAAFNAAAAANPFADIARTNMEMFAAATRMFTPGVASAGGTATDAKDAKDAKDAEIAALKAEIAAMKKERS